MTRLYPGNVGAETAALVSGFSDDLGALFVDQVFGEIYSRPALGLRERQFVTLGCLTTLGSVDLQLRIQIANSLNVGLSEGEITEAIIHSTIFAGWGRSINAMAIAREIFSR
jgi:4-carboxymuconolactone decarboxylase